MLVLIFNDVLNSMIAVMFFKPLVYS